MSTALQTTVQLPQQDIDTPFAVPDGKPTPEMTLSVVERGEAVRQAAQGWKAYAQDLARRNVVALGKDQAFVVRDGQGAARCIKTVVRLQIERDHLYTVGGKWKITAEGYTEINKVAGVQLAIPQELVINGRPHENPFLETHPSNPGVLLRIHHRVVSVGRTKTGQPVVLDYLLRWDANLYLLRGLRKASEQWKDDPSGRTNKKGDVRRVKVADPTAVEDMLQSDFVAEKAAGKRTGWAFIPTAAVFEDFLGLAFNTRNPGVREKLADHDNLIGFAERRAGTIARRNALRHNAGIGISTVVPAFVSEDGKSGHADVEVYGWPPDSRRTLREIADLVIQGTSGTAPGLTAGVTRPEVLAIEEDATPDDDEHVQDAEEAPEPDPEPNATQGGLFGGEAQS